MSNGTWCIERRIETLSVEGMVRGGVVDGWLGGRGGKIHRDVLGRA